MIYRKIIIKELELKDSLAQIHEKLEALDSLKKILNGIDAENEYIPPLGFDKILVLLEDLKGEELNRVEKQIIQEIS